MRQPGTGWPLLRRLYGKRTSPGGTLRARYDDIQRWKRDQELNDRRYEVLGEPRVRRQPLRERRRAHALRDAYDGHAACL